MLKYLRLYKTFFVYSLINNMAYPTDFITWSVIDAFWAVINIGFFKILLLNIPDISGWTFNQLTIPLGLFSLLNAFIFGTFYGNMKDLARGINRGDLDLVLTKPVSGQFMVSIKSIGLSLFPSLITGLFLLIYGFSVNHLSLFRILLVIPVLGCSVIIFYSLYFISTNLAFFSNRLNNISELLPQAADVARYPTEIFPVVIRFILTFILPLSLMAVFPARIILSQLSLIYLLVPIIMAGLLFHLSRIVWSFSLRHYSSASS